MMSIFARELSASSSSTVDIGITKLPYFSDKAAAIQESGDYPVDTVQVHLTGYDTLIRIFDAKYYEGNTLKVLKPFLERHRLRVTYRPQDKWGGKDEQDEYIRKLADGEREFEGGRREWASRIEMVEGSGNAISSTKVREAANNGDRTALQDLCTNEVTEYVLKEKLYEDVES